MQSDINPRFQIKYQHVTTFNFLLGNTYFSTGLNFFII